MTQRIPFYIGVNITC